MKVKVLYFAGLREQLERRARTSMSRRLRSQGCARSSWPAAVRGNPPSRRERRCASP